ALTETFVAVMDCRDKVFKQIHTTIQNTCKLAKVELHIVASMTLVTRFRSISQEGQVWWQRKS
nr:hypothetical protein [Planctomycetota bacterium]